MLQIFNTLTRQKETFKPLIAGQVTLYVCGITVYDQCHLGHGRSMVCFDIVVRYLRSQGYMVKFVRNITDIDDKIIKRANEKNISIDKLTDHYIKAMHEDMRKLNLIAPSMEPRATTHMVSIIQLIERLIAKQHAYVSESGDVCFQVDTFKDYGKLSHKDLDGLLAGARVEINQHKRSPLDFVLWKLAKAGEPSWSSPWGEGRPGWHIECSAMAMDVLGEQFDIHGGGRDLQFPHHENEIAQSEGVTGKCFANYWMHVGMLQIDNVKMSKSLNNFFTLAEVLENYHPEVVRYFLLSSHYRSHLNYSTETLENSRLALTRLYQTIKDHKILADGNFNQQWLEEFNQAMDDDFNTPEALAVLFRLSREINKNPQQDLLNTLKHLAGILGLLQFSIEEFLQYGEKIDRQAVENQIQERLEARLSKNWQKADLIRDELLEQGIELEDGPTGTSWKITKPI